MVDFYLVMTGYEKDNDGTNLLKCEESKDKFVLVRQLHHDSVVFLNINLHKADGCAAYLIPKFTVCETGCMINETYLIGI